ncbi:MAG: hypothetical protein PHF24_05645, partial [Syntrophomonas sp.]|nr:hypothetical protein [Syntrophomonas sp.]
NRHKLGDFKARLGKYAADIQLKPNRPKTLRVDMEIEEEDICEQLMEEIELLKPFGEGNPAPRFLMRASTINNPLWVGDNRAHLKFKTGLNHIEAIAFNRTDMNEYPLHMSSQDLLFEIDINEFRGKRSLQLKIKDLKSSIELDSCESSGRESDQTRISLKRIVEEIKEKCPVVLIYPTYRSLVKHQAVLAYYLNHENIQPLHGHLGIEERAYALNQLIKGTGKVFPITQPLLDYFLNRYDLPLNLRYVIRLWPLDIIGADPLNNNQLEIMTIRDKFNHILYHRKEIPIISARYFVYANLAKTINTWREKYPYLKAEAGLKDMKQRRAVRREFIEAGTGILVSDGTHTSGWSGFGSVDEVILADSPLGSYELTPLRDWLPNNNEVKIGVAFDRTSIERNQKYLHQLYPDADTVQEVFDFYKDNKARLRSVSIDELSGKINSGLHRKYSRLNILSIVRILADLGLCRFEKSGSIMAINPLNNNNSLSSIIDSPYYREGLAEKKALLEWENKLKNSMVW